MASLAESLALQPNPQFGDGALDAVKTGMQLAQSKQQIELQKQQVAAQKEQLAQNQMNGLGNRLRAASFSTDKSIFESRLKQAKAYADQANIPFNEEAFRNLYNNDQTRLVLQNGIRDVMTGKVPVKPEEFLGVLGSQEGLYNWGEAGITKNAETSNKNEQAMELLSTKLEAQKEIGAAKAEARDAKAQYSISKDTSDALMKRQKEFDSVIKDDVDALSQAKKAESLLMSGGTIADSAAQSVVARMFEKGVLTDSDVERLSGGRSLVQKGERLVQKMYDGKLSSEDRKELLRITQTLRPVIENKIRDRAKRNAKAAAGAYGGKISEQQFLDVYGVDDLLGGPEKGRKESSGDTQAPPPADKKTLFVQKAKAAGYSDDEIAAKLKERGL